MSGAWHQTWPFESSSAEEIVRRRIGGKAAGRADFRAMARGRLLLLGLGVTALLAVAAVASGGRPLSRSKGTGPSPAFFDYVFTTIVIFAVAITVIVVLALALQRPGPFKPPPRRWRILSTLATLLLSAAAALIFLHSGLGHRLQKLNLHGQPAGQSGARRNGKAGANARNAHVRWDEIAVVARARRRLCRALRSRQQQAGAPPVAPRARRRRCRSRSTSRSTTSATSPICAARSSPPTRGWSARSARRPAAPPSEAPFEYVERALASSRRARSAYERLTTLFEWAKFSQHEPGPEMRDEAIDALVAVRDELRAAVDEPVAA